MIQYNYPTVIFYGKNSIQSLPPAILKDGCKRVLIITDNGLVEAGIAEQVKLQCLQQNLHVDVFSNIHSNPLEEDVLKARQYFLMGQYDAIIGLGGGSAMDVAKTVKFLAVHEPPLAQYDDAIGGDALITNEMPPLYAIPTTAGTGSEVGRSSVVTLQDTGRKTIFFHPDLMPNIAVLDPNFTIKLPPHITVATGIDAFSHCLEAFLVDSFHPMADAIALEGLKMIVENLPKVVENGNDIDARGKMLLSATMGATAFQKGLGMIHSIAHALSAHKNTHHGLANALAMPFCLEFTYQKATVTENKSLLNKLEIINNIFDKNQSLYENVKQFIKSLNVNLGLINHNFNEEDISTLSEIAFEDACHSTHPFAVSLNDFTHVLTQSMKG
jgi:alcohol dehydrogenase class IV